MSRNKLVPPLLRPLHRLHRIHAALRLTLALLALAVMLSWSLNVFWVRNVAASLAVGCVLSMLVFSARRVDYLRSLTPRQRAELNHQLTAWLSTMTDPTPGQQARRNRRHRMIRATATGMQVSAATLIGLTLTSTGTPTAQLASAGTLLVLVTAIMWMCRTDT